MRYKLLLFTIFFALVFISCEDYVTEVDPLVYAVEDEVLDEPTQIPFLIKGVKQRFATATSELFIIADGLSDAFFFDNNVPNATYTSYNEIDNGEIFLDNNSVDAALYDIGELRYFADRLIERVQAMSGVDDADYRAAMFNGYFYGGVARYYYATYFGLEPNRGGGTIDNSAFIDSPEMYGLAIEKFVLALDYVANDAEARIVNSFIARAHLYNEDYSQAAVYAVNGMQEGDDDFLALYSPLTNNTYYVHAGTLRKQFVVDYRYHDYIVADSQEVNRIDIGEVYGNDGTLYYYQTRYFEASSPIPLMTWQENNLMLAELALRGQGSGDALSLVNSVRASHDIEPLDNIDLDVLLQERDKELFVRASRLPDQRRFDKWHLDPGTWQYLPLTEGERNANPNL